MITRFRPALLLYSYLLLWFVVAPLRSCSFQPTKNHRTIEKARDRFTRWKSNYREHRENLQLLWIDGNNVRGVGKFEWNAVELQQRVVRFCHKYKIPNAIVVWDHGNDKFSCSTRYYFNESDTESPVAVVADTDANSKFCVNLVILFSGLRQRADDVMVRESNHLIESLFRKDCQQVTELNWSSLGFVTNDRDLNYKLRQQATSAPLSIRLGRRKRRDNGRKHGNNIDSAKSSDQNKDRNTPVNPLFCDSTGFLELLYELPREYDMNMIPTDAEASESIDEAKSSIRSCSHSQRRGYNPRREKTWERCVQAEIFRRFLGGSLRSEENQSSDVELPLGQDDKDAVFMANYLRELQSARQFSSTVEATGKDTDNGHTDSLLGQYMPYLGPARLDKHQRRLLDRYNAMVRNERCERC